MLEVLTDLPTGVDGVRAHGKVTREDVRDVLYPLLAHARDEGRRVRFLYEFAPDFDGFSAGAAFADLRLGLSSIRLLERMAIVTDVPWIRQSTLFIASLMPFVTRVFPVAERDDAALWLAEEPVASDLTHRLLADQGVLVLDVQGKLGVEDFDALSLVVDPWIEAHGALHGLVIHARRFPGWEGLGGMLRHLRFVREHQRKIERIAIAGDGAVLGMMPTLGDPFVHAELRAFDYDRVDEAIAWASRGHVEGQIAAST